MKILLLYQDYITLLDDLVFYLNKNHIEADSFDIVNWRFLGNSKNKLPLIVKTLAPLLRIPKVHGLLLELFQKKVLLDLASKYDIIDIQYFGPVYDKVIPRFKTLDKLIKITIWGSDFYRIGKERTEVQRSLFALVNVIQLPTERMKKDFIGKFPEYEFKIKVLHYGTSIFEAIKELDDPEKISIYRKELGISDDAVVLTCGYNGSPGQQHMKILEAIANLDKSLQNEIWLLVPMTYGTSDNYLMDIKVQIEKIGLPYTIFTKWMNENEIAKMKLLTDIAINIQVTDAFSASVQEHIFAGNVIIVGDWLPYDYLEENKIYHINTNLHDLPEKLSLCLANLNIHKQRAVHNKGKIYSVSSWENSIKDWVSIYCELNNE
jgi:glycosyltransferase involved in cell wall biosynthesis